MIPRSSRDMARGRRAADAVIARGGSALDAATAHIRATFSQAAVINRSKLNVERVLRRPMGNNASVARYGRLVALLQNLTLDSAIARLDELYRQERRTQGAARALGCGSNALEVLGELRLMLRLARVKITDRQFRQMVLRVALRASVQ